MQKLRLEGKTIPQWSAERGFPVRSVRADLYGPKEGALRAFASLCSGYWVEGRGQVNMLSSTEPASIVQLSRQAAHRLFVGAAEGKAGCGHHLPVVALPGKRGGASGMVWAIDVSKASPDLRTLLKLPETLPSTPIDRRIRTRPDDRHGTTALEKRRIIAAILAHPKGSSARAAAFRVAAMQRHKVWTGWQTYSDLTLRAWVQAAEAGGVAALMPVARSDKGKRRV